MNSNSSKSSRNKNNINNNSIDENSSHINSREKKIDSHNVDGAASSTNSSWIADDDDDNDDENNNNCYYQEGEEYYIPLRDDHGHENFSTTQQQQRRSRRRFRRSNHENQIQDSHDNITTAARHRAAAAGTTATATSLSDRITSSAVSGTLGLLRLASDVTLSTTGMIVAPPLLATQHVLVPTLYHALMEYISSITSQRIKDWFRIVQSSVYHLFSVLQSTPAGQEFRQELVQVCANLMDCISSDASRQIICDAMACLVKLFQAMHTPQVKELLDQLGILSCRCIDGGLYGAGGGRVKQLWCHLFDTIWSGTAVLADPATTLAMAEVTAHLCHALEMEQAIQLQQQKKRQRKPRQGEGTTATSAGNSVAANQRYRRNRYQANAYVNTDLTVDPDATVEDVILSSLSKNTGLGGGLDMQGPIGAVPARQSSTTTPSNSSNNNRKIISKQELMSNNKKREVPHQVTLKPSTATSSIAEEKVDEEDDDDDERKGILESRHEDDSSHRHSVGGMGEQQSLASSTAQQQHQLLYNPIPGKAREETVDVEYLRECIMQEQQQQQQQPSDRDMPQSTLRMKRDDPAHHDNDGNHRIEHDLYLETLEDVEELGVPRKKTLSRVTNVSSSQSDVVPIKTTLASSTAAVPTPTGQETTTTTGPNQKSKSRQKPLIVVEDVPHEDDEDDDDDCEGEVSPPTLGSAPCQQRSPTVPEAPVAQFYRILDEILSEKREMAIQSLLEQTGTLDDERDQHDQLNTTDATTAIGKDSMDAARERVGRVWYPRAAAAAGVGNERGQATIRNQLMRLSQHQQRRRGDAAGGHIGVGYTHRGRSSIGPPSSYTSAIPRKYHGIVLCCMAAMFLLTTIWFGLGCFGIYKLMYPQSRYLETAVRSTPTKASSPAAQNEFIIRIIQEVVHVNAAELEGVPAKADPQLTGTRNLDDSSVLLTKWDSASVPFFGSAQQEEKAKEQLAECVRAVVVSPSSKAAAVG